MRQGYGGDPLGCGEAGLTIYDWSTFYPKRVRDFNDAQRVFANGSLSGFTETLDEAAKEDSSGTRSLGCFES